MVRGRGRAGSGEKSAARNGQNRPQGAPPSHGRCRLYDRSVTVMNRMDGKVCIVTGSTQGLGAAIARRLAEAGAEGLVTLGRNASKGRAVAEEIVRETGVPVHFVEADLGDVGDCRTVVAEAERVYGHIDVLVNAGARTDRG